MGKHVIFLGAGASYGSGYPLANDLRLLMSSRRHWEKKLVEYENTHRISGRIISDGGTKYWDNRREVLELFRNGGFATLDEFCRLAGGFKFQDEINELRQLVRAALGLFNPEENFEKSEYYGFIQKLFKGDLGELREDITVLTYNYDPYLDFLLRRALEQRWQVKNRKQNNLVVDDAHRIRIEEHERTLNAVTSGFHSISEHKWLAEDAGGSHFCLLKLHGSIGHSADQVANYEVLFSKDPVSRAGHLFGNFGIPVPMVFPWEIMTENRFVQEERFPIKGSPVLFKLFKGIWERARREILSANKISFVGLSMHQYLYGGLKYLFEGKNGKVEICVANLDNPISVRDDLETFWHNQPHTSAHLIFTTLKKVAPDMSQMGVAPGSSRNDNLTLVKDFSAFVRTRL